MTKLCPRGKAAAKRKFKVYPSAYANAYASKICAGKIKDPSGVKRKDFRGSKAEGGLMEATARLKRQGLKEGGNSKSRTNPDNLTGKQILELDKWFAQKWVDIGSKKKDGSFSKCGRSKQKADAKRKYPKCVPLAKARRMTEGQRRSAVKRKRAVAQGVGGKPTNVKTFAKRAKAMGGGFMARRASYV